MSIASLSRTMPPPAHPHETSGSWEEIEHLLKKTLPEDYKAFISAYGSGTIGHFISVLNPFSTRPGLNLLEQTKLQLEALSILHSDFGEPQPYPLHPDPQGLLPVAITDNGDVVHWLTGNSPAGWSIVVNEARSPDYEAFDCNLTTFLDGLLRHTIKCRAFPNVVFEKEAEFSIV